MSHLYDYWQGLPRRGWQHHAACVGMIRAWWFEHSNHADARYARRVCARCPVADDCLAFAMRVEPAGAQFRYGIFGGMTGPERERFAAVLHHDRKVAA